MTEPLMRDTGDSTGPIPAGTGGDGGVAADAFIASPRCVERDRIEIDRLVEGIHRHYGFDYRDYSQASLRRRVLKFVEAEKRVSISDLQEHALHDPACMDRLLLALSVNVTSMFRDPGFFAALRREVGILATYPSIRIWCAGCSTGEEAYSVAILLEEEGLYDRARIYATDTNEAVLRRSKNGVFDLTHMREYTGNYQQAGGTRTFSDYYTAAYGSVMMRPSLRRNMVFSRHNLASDGPFNEFHMVLCRNVMIYFNRTLQERVHDLIHRSLMNLGILGLGRRESLHLASHEQDYQVLSEAERLYRKVP
jgi:chemotaxis protein methyltransferase CheR